MPAVRAPGDLVLGPGCGEAQRVVLVLLGMRRGAEGAELQRGAGVRGSRYAMAGAWWHQPGAGAGAGAAAELHVMPAKGHHLVRPRHQCVAAAAAAAANVLTCQVCLRSCVLAELEALAMMLGSEEQGACWIQIPAGSLAPCLLKHM